MLRELDFEDGTRDRRVAMARQKETVELGLLFKMCQCLLCPSGKSVFFLQVSEQTFLFSLILISYGEVGPSCQFCYNLRHHNGQFVFEFVFCTIRISSVLFHEKSGLLKGVFAYCDSFAFSFDIMHTVLKLELNYNHVFFT